MRVQVGHILVLLTCVGDVVAGRGTSAPRASSSLTGFLWIPVKPTCPRWTKCRTSALFSPADRLIVGHARLTDDREMEFENLETPASFTALGG